MHIGRPSSYLRSSLRNNLMSLGHLTRTALQHGKVILNMTKRINTCPPYSQKVLWDEKNKQFSVTIEGEKAFIDYRKRCGVLDLVHTEVPEVFRGHGIAAVLAKGTFELIKEKNLHMKLSCDYLQSYYKKNKSDELTNLLIEEQRNTL